MAFTRRRPYGGGPSARVLLNLAVLFCWRWAVEGGLGSASASRVAAAAAASDTRLVTMSRVPSAIQLAVVLGLEPDSAEDAAEDARPL